jgi:hypothetical protein
MRTHKVVEEPLETGGNGKPIFGYRVPNAAVQDFCKKARQLVGDGCLFATKPDGDHTKVVIFPTSNKPTGEFLDAIAQLTDQNDISISRLGPADFDVNNVAFKANTRRQKQ